MNLHTKKNYNPWFYFLVFLGADSFLTYAPGFDIEKYIVFSMVILSPILFLVFIQSPASTGPELQKDRFEGSRIWIWFFPALLLMALRFWKLTSFFFWPTGDEASTGMIGLGLLRDPNLDFFHGFGQTPLLFHWTFALFYDLTRSPILSLWLLPAILSASLIPLTYWGARRFCGPSFSILLAGMMAVGLWPIYLGRSGYPIFVLVWEIAALFFLLRFLRQFEKGPAIVSAAVLGLVTGLGSLTTTCWIAVGFLDLAVVAWVTYRKKALSTFLVFFFALTVALTPFLIAFGTESYGAHIEAMGFWNDPSGLQHLVQRFLDYWMILWGSAHGRVIYGISPGGFLNPLLAALFFLGLVELARRFSKTALLLFLLALALCLSTGYLSRTLQMYRVLTVLPFLFFTTALGLDQLLASLSARRGILLVFVLLGGSFILDMSRLAKPYVDPEKDPQAFQDTGRAYEKYRAGKVLDRLQEIYGPGLLYTDLGANSQDESLALMTYSYNCAWNPDLASQNPKWAALVVEDSRYQPFLAKRFPAARWVVLPTPNEAEYGPQLLCVVPVTQEVRIQLDRWTQTYHFLMAVNLELLDRANGRSRVDVLERILQFYPQVPKDPFLQSVYLAKWLDMYSRERFFHPFGVHIPYEKYVGLLEGALAIGYPEPWVDTYVGRLMMLEDHPDQARPVIAKVLKLAPDNKLARQLWKTLSKGKE